MQTVSEIKERLNYFTAKIDILNENRSDKEARIDNIKEDYNDLVKARWVISEVAKITQQKVKSRIENLVTMAIRSVFDRSFEFKLIFEEKYKRFTCRPVMVEDGFEFDPKREKGGSLIAIISFACRIVLWSLENPRSRNMFWSDEQFGAIGRGEMLFKVGRMLKEICKPKDEWPGFQLIMVTHEPQLAEIADKVFEVSHDGVESRIEEVGAVAVKRKIKKIKR